MQVLSSEMATNNFQMLLGAGTVATIGNFDGVHLGHRHLLSLTMKKAQALGCKSLVITFEPRPIEVLAPMQTGARLLSRQDQFAVMQDLGVDFLFVQKFDAAFATIGYEDFIQNTLLKKLHIRHLVVGHDFAMGKSRLGTAQAIATYLQSRQIETEIADAVLAGETPISTSRIKKNLEAGFVAEANAMLGRDFYLQGRVVHGAKRGRTIGVPTANIEVDSKIKLKFGVYATVIEINGKSFNSVTNIGLNPTIEDADQSIKVECHIFSFRDEIYDQSVKVYLKQFIRPEQKFANVQELKTQIELDIIKAKELLK